MTSATVRGVLSCVGLLVALTGCACTLEAIGIGMNGSWGQFG